MSPGTSTSLRSRDILPSRSTLLVAAVICVTMVFTVLCAKAVGCLLPLLAERIHLDPAVMASPFISTVVDVVTLVLYFQVARAILHI